MAPALSYRARAPRLRVEGAARPDRGRDPGSGRLRCVVDELLELGIDMGAVELRSRWSRAAGRERPAARGRAGHQVGEISKGVLFPKHRADLLHASIAVERMREGLIEAIAVPQNPLDVLAQQTSVAAASQGELDVEEWFDTVRRAPFATLPRSAYEATRSTCSRGGIRPTSSPSCARASCGTGRRAPSPAGRARSGSP